MTEQEFIEKEVKNITDSKAWLEGGASGWIGNIFKKGFEIGKKYSEENNEYKYVIEQIATSTQPFNVKELHVWHEIVMKLTNDALKN